MKVKEIVKAVIIISFGIMIYCGLRGYELPSDYAMIVFVVSTIVSVFIKDK